LQKLTQQESNYKQELQTKLDQTFKKKMALKEMELEQSFEKKLQKTINEHDAKMKQ